jgi:hypothetical protein
MTAAMTLHTARVRDGFNSQTEAVRQKAAAAADGETANVGRKGPGGRESD